MTSLTVSPETYAKLVDALAWRWQRDEVALRAFWRARHISPVWHNRPVWRLRKWTVGAVNAMFALASLPEPYTEEHA